MNIYKRIDTYMNFHEHLGTYIHIFISIFIFIYELEEKCETGGLELHQLANER